MNAVEWLRAVARRTDSDAVAEEAAEALAWFAQDPAGLVVACRRLLAHHPESAPLWWLCSTVVTATDPEEAADRAGATLRSDPTAEHLEAALPLLGADEPVLVLGWPAAIDRAVARRPDLVIVAARVAGADPSARLRVRTTDATVRIVDELDVDVVSPAHVLVAAHAWGPGRVIVPLGTHSLISAAGPRPPVWLVGGVGRALPDRVLDVVEGALIDPEGAAETISLERFDRVVGPRGVVTRDDAVRHVECPIAPELLRP